MTKGKVRSFADRLTRRIVLVLLIIMGLTAFWLFALGASFVLEEETYRHEAMIQATAEHINHVISDIYVAVNNQMPEIEESLDRPDRMMKLVERTVAQNPRIRSCGISFVENYYPGKGRGYMPYAVRRDSSHIEVNNFGAERQNYLGEDWFLKALDAKDGFWSEPFFEGNDSVSPLVAYVRPVFDQQGRAVAVLGADISLDWLREKMEKADWDLYCEQWTGFNEERRARREEFWKPYSMIVSRKGTFIVHPDERRIIRDSIGSIVKASKDTVLVTMAQRILEEKSSKIFEVTDEDNYECSDFDGRSGYVFFTPINHAGWSLVLFTPALSLDMIAYFIGALLAFFVLLAVVIVWLVSRYSIKRAAKPLKQLASSADEVAKGNFEVPLPYIKHRDEIGNLRDAMEDMQHSLARYVSELQETTASKAAIEQELKTAHDIQMAMLPKIFPPFPERDDIDIYGQLTPAKDVGGDLFDFFILDEKLFFCIGDVSGKGVPASLVMAMTRSLFRNVSLHVSEPNVIVSALNAAVAEGNETNMFVTVFLGVLDLQTGVLQYCNAGHNSPLLLDEEVKTLPCDANVPIGVMAEMSFSRQEIQLEKPTTIFLYTDGLSEAENSMHALFGEQRINHVAEEQVAQGVKEPAAVIYAMNEEVHRFVGEAEQSDDLTMLAIKYIKK